MINPETITDYGLDDRGLEEHILFWICAAAKNGRTAARCLDRFLTEIDGHEAPFRAINTICAKNAFGFRPYLPDILKKCGIGCYNHKAAAFGELSSSFLDLHTCTVSDLESIHGIGPKTARCFLLHSRRDAQVAGLDTHMLKYLRSLGYDAPKSTPTGKKYLDMEKTVLMLASEAGMTPADYDLWVWMKYSVPSTPKE